MNVPTENGAPSFPDEDANYLDKVRWARAIPEDRKFFLGLAMFEDICARMRSGILSQFPIASPAEVDAILAQRFARLRQVHDQGIYFPLDEKPE